jgi:hypothetical protein
LISDYGDRDLEEQVEYSNSVTNERHRSRTDRDCADLETLRELTAGLPPEPADLDRVILEHQEDREFATGETGFRQQDGELTHIREVLAPIREHFEHEIEIRSGFKGMVRDDERLHSGALDVIAKLLDEDSDLSGRHG